MKIFFKIILFLVVIMVLALGYTGFVPGVSTVMGTNKAIDLGVIVSDEALTSGNAKVGVSREGLPGDTPISQSIRYEGSHPLNIEMSGEEITSLYKDGGWEFSSWAKDFQMKIKDDGRMEISTVVKIDSLDKYIEATNIADVQRAKEYIKTIGIVGNEFPVYAIGAGNITDSKVTLNMETVKIGRVPVTVTKEANEIASSYITKRINSIPGFNIKSVRFENGKIKFEGDVPDKIRTLTQ